MKKKYETQSQVDKKIKMFNYIIENQRFEPGKQFKKDLLEALKEYIVFGVKLDQEFFDFTGFSYEFIEKKIKVSCKEKLYN